MKAKDLRQIRISWGDQHGILRGKTLTVTEFLSSLEDGKDFQFVTSIFDTTNHPIVPPFGAGNFAGAPELTGLPDGVLVPDPTTFRLLPWVEKTGWILSDAYFQNGREHPFSTRGVLRRQLADLATLGYDFVAGLEIEFYVFRLLDPNLAPEQCGYPPEPPTVNGLAHGFQYLTENRNDEIHDLLWVLQEHTERLGLPLLTIEDEWGAGQIEFTFAPETGTAGSRPRAAVPQRDQAGLPPPRLPRDVHGAPGVSRLLRERLARAPVAVAASTAAATPSPTTDGERRLTDARACSWLAGLLEHAVAGVGVHDADHQRLQALPARLVRARPRRVGDREPRRAAARDRRARVARLTTSRTASATRRRTRTSTGVADRAGARRHPPQARPGRRPSRSPTWRRARRRSRSA